MRLLALIIALPLLACGDRNRTPDTPPNADAAPASAPATEAPRACSADVECVGSWRPSMAGCASIERCFGGQCITPPTSTGVANAETGRLVFEVDGAERPFQVELVDAPFETTRGMMCRPSMQADWGMLFFMQSTRVQSFWMFNTLISLDLVFLDEHWTIVGIVPRAEPLSRQGRSVGVPSRYVLELQGGAAALAGLEAGLTARFYPPRGT